MRTYRRVLHPMTPPHLTKSAARPTAASLRWALLAAACLFPGCTSPSRLSFLSWRPKPEAYTIDYAIADVGGNLSPKARPGGSSIQSAAWIDDSQEPAFGPHRSASLRIEFPHPIDGPGAALATLAIYDDPASAPEFASSPSRRHWWSPLTAVFTSRKKQPPGPSSAPSEVVTMTIPRAQFEMLMSDLHRGEYTDDPTFGPNAPPDRGVSLSISHNRREAHHASVSEPRLDEFMRRVYWDGDVILGDRQFDQAIVGLSAEVSAPDPQVN